MDTVTQGATQSVFLNIPSSDWQLLKDLSRKFGWEAKTANKRLAAFSKSRPKDVGLSDEDIMKEVQAVRYISK